jgi:broad specificity phosphatase PhoE
MSELYLVRHAQASFGKADYDRLSALGHQQATWLGEFFKFRNIRFDRIICGDMVRHHETLDRISAAMGSNSDERQTHAQWNEFDFEALFAAYLTDHPEQKLDNTASASLISRLLQKTLQAWANGELCSDIPETWAEFEQRVFSGLSIATSSIDNGSKTLVVTSGGAIAMAVRQVLAAPPEAMIRMNLQIRNSAYSHLFFDREGIHLAGFNHAPHLEHPDRSNAVTYY